uniref:Adenylyltransferase and sulfurtransferase MOCS3 homolog n=2 Tax=Hirondellea gigas TaxID=1518452 RepID=A0A6A7G6H5_9CRUS
MEDPPFLSNDQILRYGRHLILPAIGMDVQRRICNSSVLVVGAGGLGSPVLQYLAGAGVGRIGIIDADEVDISNLHRQVIHSESEVSNPKVDSARDSCLAINSSIIVETFNERFSRSNAIELVQNYDLVADCTDNVSSRYLINDIAVMCGKPDVSGGAIGTEGQLTVYNYKGGPCYRCLHPKPPPPETVSNCSDNGVLGVVPGIIGSLQAMEILKIVGQFGEPLSAKLLIFDGLSCSFRSMRLRSRSPTCDVCGDKPTIPNVLTDPTADLIDYNEFCGSCHVELDAKDCPSVSCEEYKSIVDQGDEHVLLDVRELVQYEICSLPNSINIPFAQMKERIGEVFKEIGQTDIDPLFGKPVQPVPVYLICRRGIDSLSAARLLLSKDAKNVINIRGGLLQWHRTIDSEFPLY